MKLNFFLYSKLTSLIYCLMVATSSLANGTFPKKNDQAVLVVNLSNQVQSFQEIQSVIQTQGTSVYTKDFIVLPLKFYQAEVGSFTGISAIKQRSINHIYLIDTDRINDSFFRTTESSTITLDFIKNLWEQNQPINTSDLRLYNSRTHMKPIYIRFLNAGDIVIPRNIGNKPDENVVAFHINASDLALTGDVKNMFSVSLGLKQVRGLDKKIIGASKDTKSNVASQHPSLDPHALNEDTELLAKIRRTPFDEDKLNLMFSLPDGFEGRSKGELLRIQERFQNFGLMLGQNISEGQQLIEKIRQIKTSSSEQIDEIQKLETQLLILKRAIPEDLQTLTELVRLVEILNSNHELIKRLKSYQNDEVKTQNISNASLLAILTFTFLAISDPRSTDVLDGHSQIRAMIDSLSHALYFIFDGPFPTQSGFQNVLYKATPYIESFLVWGMPTYISKLRTDRFHQTVVTKALEALTGHQKLLRACYAVLKRSSEDKN